MEAKTVIINGVPGYTIERKGNDIEIKVINLHPFDYSYELYSNMLAITQDIPKDKINVYIKFPKTKYFSGNTYQIIFDKATKNFEF